MVEKITHSIAQWQIIAAAAIFLICYAVIVSEKINRSIIALCGALLMVLLGIVDLHTAYTKHIHWATIFLLLGMMMLVGVINRSGIFEYIAVKTAQSAKGDPVKIMIRLALLTAVGAAFIDNVTTVLLVAPITVSIANTMRMNPVPFLVTQILVCNIGGAATLVGDPPNIMIGLAAGFSFNQFLIHITPIIIVCLIVTNFFVKRYFAKYLHVDEQYKDILMGADARDYIRDSDLAKKSIFVFILTIVGFLTHQYVHVEPATVALSGATLLMLIGTKGHDVEEVFHAIEWPTIFFFAGLFVLVGGLVEVGIIKMIAAWMIEVTGGDVPSTALIMLWGAGIGSAFIDNIPLVATMIPMVHDMGARLALTSVEINTLWWSLALGACLGGNGTIIGSSANLIVAAIAAREGSPITFINYLKVSIPVTLVTLALAHIYIYIVYIRLGFA